MNDRSTGWPAAVLIAAAFFVATAPTLAWLEFSSSMENLTVATALEIRREHRWLLPTLEGEPRVAKPPLAAWIAAATIRPATLAHLDDPDLARRDAAYRALAWDIRWPGLLCSCLMLLAVFDLGKTLGDSPPVGLTAMIVAGSSLYLLRFGRQATTDVQLALWVSIADAALARLLLRGPSWRAAIVAGIALGLALMSKGPVTLLLTLMPACVFATVHRSRTSHAQVALALLLTLLVGATWYIFVFLRVPGVWDRWRIELTRTGTGERSDNPLSYVSLLLYMLPWTPVFIHGLVWTAVETWRRKIDGWSVALLLVLVPIVVMSFFPDRKERYLLPLAGPAAVLAARGIGAMLDPAEKRRIPPWVQWATVAVLAVGLPFAGAIYLKKLDGTRWYPPIFAACVAVVLAMLIIIAIQQARRYPFIAVIAPAVIMLILGPIFFLGYRDTREGRSEMRPLAQTIRFAAPDAQLYNWRPEGQKRADVSLSIYLNRPTIWIGDPSQVRQGERPQVMITQQKTDRAPRVPPGPPGEWRWLDSVAHDKDFYVAFVRAPR